MSIKFGQPQRVIGIAIPRDLYAELIHRRIQSGMSMSKLVRIMIRDYIKRNPIFNITPDVSAGDEKIAPESSK